VTLTVEDLHVSYGGAVRALRGVSLTVPDGAIVAVLGSNGAGKSTLLRAVSGTLRRAHGRVERGTIRLGDTDLAALDAAAIVRLGVAHVPEGRRVFGRLTVEENLRAGGLSRPGRWGGRDRADKAAARDRIHALFPILEERRTQRGALLSGGEQQMLAIGRALMAAPKLLLLDEPSLGLAPRVIGQIGEVITEINRQGTSVLLIEQNATMALRVADTAHVLDVGRVSLSGPAGELAANDDVRRLYLGSGGDRPKADRPAQRSLSRWPG